MKADASTAPLVSGAWVFNPKGVGGRKRGLGPGKEGSATESPLQNQDPRLPSFEGSWSRKQGAHQDRELGSGWA